jgi:sugar phosphate isomerase/epimerase
MLGAEAPIISLSSACLYHLPLRSCFRLAAEAGYAGVELVMGPEVALRGPRAVARLARAYGLVIPSVHHALYRLGPEAWRDRRPEQATRLALELGAPRVVIHGPWATDWAEPAARRWLRELDRCQRLTRGTGTRLALENPGIYNDDDARNVLADDGVLLRFAIEHDLDLTFDTCHVGTGQVGLLHVYARLRPRVANIHLSDLRPSLLQRSRLLRSVASHHQYPGEGDLPLTEVLCRLASDGYTGSITLEVSLFALHFWSWGAMRRRLAGAAEFVRAGLLSAAPNQALRAPLTRAPGVEADPI